jgi:hypothetical protein
MVAGNLKVTNGVVFDKVDFDMGFLRIVEKFFTYLCEIIKITQSIVVTAS